MKKTILAAIAILTSLNLFAQGTVWLDNRTSLGISHVWGCSQYLSLIGYGSNDLPSGPTPYEAVGCVLIGANGTGGRFGAATTFAQLLAANGANQPESSLVPMGQTTTFRTGTAAGGLALITDTLEGIPADSPAATLELVVWDNSSGLYPTWTEASVAWRSGMAGAFGRSGAFTVLNIGGNWNTPPAMLIPSFNIYATPEPSAFVLVGLGVVALAIFLRRS
jgi:hypothetical protein